MINMSTQEKEEKEEIKLYILRFSVLVPAGSIKIVDVSIPVKFVRISEVHYVSSNVIDFRIWSNLLSAQLGNRVDLRYEVVTENEWHENIFPLIDYFNEEKKMIVEIDNSRNTSDTFVKCEIHVVVYESSRGE